MLGSTISCAPRPIVVGSGATDCAWAQTIYLGEDAIAALRQREHELRDGGDYIRASRLRVDRKAIADHNRLVEINCAAADRY